MKKIIAIALIAFAIVAACQKEADVANPVSSQQAQLSKNFNLQDQSFPREVGSMISKVEANTMQENYLNFMKKTGMNEAKVVKSTTFGINTFEKLLSQKDCVGIRFSYGMSWQDEKGNATTEGEGIFALHLILTAIDKNGNELIMDLPNAKTLDGGYAGFDHGGLCPPICADN